MQFVLLTRPVFTSPSCSNLPHGFYEQQLLGEHHPVLAASLVDCDGIQSALAHSRSRNVSTLVPLELNPTGLLTRPVCAHTAGYFSQFGKLTKVRLSRNKKTGKSKHYAFMEFQHPEVATIAAGQCA
jgi:hypothetical protein